MGLSLGQPLSYASTALTLTKGVGYSAAALALFPRFTTPPTDARKRDIDALIIALQTAGVWTKLDALYLLAAADAQAARLNWRQALYDCTAVNSPIFTANRGYAGDGSTSYLNTAFTPSTAAGQLSLNSAHLSIWNRTSRVAAGSVEMGISGAQGAPELQVAGRFSGNIFVGSCNDTQAIAAASSNNAGHFLANRSASNVRQLFRNGSSVSANASVSTALPTIPAYILGRNSAGLLNLGSTDQLAAASIGSSLTSTEAAAFYAALQTYMTAVGA